MRVSIVLALAALVAAPATAAERRYNVSAGESRLTARTGRAGMFGFMGHTHEIITSTVEGQVVADEADLSRSSVTLTFAAGALKVTGKGEPADEVAEVQATMVGPKLLDVARHPQVTFRSTAVSGRKLDATRWQLDVTGELALHGVTRQLTFPVVVQLGPDSLSASGSTQIRHTDFGMKPVSVAGVVKVKNEIGLEFGIVAKAGP